MLLSKVAKLHLHVNPKACNCKTIAMGILPQEVPPWAVSEVVRHDLPYQGCQGSSLSEMQKRTRGR